jgi:hypothetical protein
VRARECLEWMKPIRVMWEGDGSFFTVMYPSESLASSWSTQERERGVSGAAEPLGDVRVFAFPPRSLECETKLRRGEEEAVGGGESGKRNRFA